MPLEPEPVGVYYGPDREQRELVQLQDLPPALTDAILAVEDQRFPNHQGIDPRRIAGALIANLKAGSVTQGGSTLTQQLVKNFFLTPERTYTRKLQEAVMALLVEWHYDKSEILEAYLNEIYLGQRGPTAVHGVGQAARLYFGKHARDLEPAECALLAAIIQSPNARSPNRNPERAIERRNLVLDLMHEQGRLDRAAWERARAEPLLLAEITPDSRDARYFLAALRRELPEHYDPETLGSEGLRIHATVDLRLQLAAARALREGLEAIEKRHPDKQREEPVDRLQGCVVALRPQTGEVLALVGGPRLQRVAVRPLHPGAPPRGQRVQAVRLHRRARTHPGGRGHHARGLPLGRPAPGEDALGGVDAAELRSRVPRPRPRPHRS